MLWGGYRDGFRICEAPECYHGSLPVCLKTGRTPSAGTGGYVDNDELFINETLERGEKHIPTWDMLHISTFIRITFFESVKGSLLMAVGVVLCTKW